MRLGATAVPESPHPKTSRINGAGNMLKTLLTLTGLWAVTLSMWAAGLGIVGFYIGKEKPPGIAAPPPSTYIILAMIIAWLTWLTVKKSLEMVRG